MQNETANDRVIAAAIRQVRGLDLSHRPWDNGWGSPQQPGDISEGHPYRSANPSFRLPSFTRENGIPDNGPRTGAGPPYLINEYGWLWINRDGTLPTLTVEVYKRILGEHDSVDARRLYYARMLAAKTEFWRVRRQCCGVLHFCGLGYSRPDGQTSDNFIDVKNLTYEPQFFKYVRDAFAPIGVAIDYWQDRLPKGSTARVPVRVINDRNAQWSGEIVLRLMQDDRVLSEQRKAARAERWNWVAPSSMCLSPKKTAPCNWSPKFAAPTVSRSAASVTFRFEKSRRTCPSAARSRRRLKSAMPKAFSPRPWRLTVGKTLAGRPNSPTINGWMLISAA